MALVYKATPPSFGLTEDLLREVRKEEGSDLYVHVHRLAVVFRASTIRAVLASGPTPVSVATFKKQFLHWLGAFSESALAESRKFLRERSPAHRWFDLKVAFTDSGGASAAFGKDEAKRRSEASRASSGEHASSSGRSHTSAKEQSRQDAADARFTGASAAETTSAAQVLETKAQLQGKPLHDLSALQYPQALVESHVEVSRGNYSKVVSDIVLGANGGYVITGPTGCGKSTVALLYLFLNPASRVLVVEPTQANAANIFHEFRHILPSLAKRIKAPPVPAVSFIAPSVAKPPYTPLMVTTTDKYLEYFEYYGKVFPADYVVIDEFHLPILSMVRMVELVRTFELAKKYVLVSATARGVKVVAALPPAVTRMTGRLEVGVVPRPLAGSDLDPRRWASRGDGTFGVVTPSVAVAQELYREYRRWGLRAYLITRNTYVSEYVRAVADYSPKVVFAMEPGVEAGVTLSMAVLASMGATTAIRYDGKVVVEDTQPLDSISAIQRGGRGGRVVPTLYIEPPAPDVAPPASSATYYRAQALIWLRSMGADLTKVGDRSVFDVFPRLKTVSRELARACILEGGDPFVAVYKHNNEGKVFVECGGDGAGFEALAKNELFLYHWPGGFFVAPIADLSMPENDPSLFVVRDHQLRSARAMVRAIDGLEGRYTFEKLVELVIQKLDTYLDDLFDTLRKYFTGARPTPFHKGNRAADIEDFVAGSPEVTKLFAYLMTEPSGVRYERVDHPGSPPRASHSFVHGKKVLNFSFDDRYMREGYVDVPALSRDVFDGLKSILAVEMLLNGAPERCVDLTEYAKRVQSNQRWFNKEVRRGL